MEIQTTPKKPKPPPAAVKTAPVRVSKATKRRVLTELVRLNKKELVNMGDRAVSLDSEEIGPEPEPVGANDFPSLRVRVPTSGDPACSVRPHDLAVNAQPNGPRLFRRVTELKTVLSGGRQLEVPFSERRSLA